jgi:hypothetical protein
MCGRPQQGIVLVPFVPAETGQRTRRAAVRGEYHAFVCTNASLSPDIFTTLPRSAKFSSFVPQLISMPILRVRRKRRALFIWPMSIFRLARSAEQCGGAAKSIFCRARTSSLPTASPRRSRCGRWACRLNVSTPFKRPSRSSAVSASIGDGDPSASAAGRSPKRFSTGVPRPDRSERAKPPNCCCGGIVLSPLPYWVGAATGSAKSGRRSLRPRRASNGTSELVSLPPLP